MAKFELGQAVRVIREGEKVFCGHIAEIHGPGPIYYRVEDEYKGQVFAMTVEENWLEPEEPDVVWRKTKVPTLDTGALAQSLKSLCFFLGGTHVAGWVDEAERAAREGRVVKYE